MGLSIGVHLLNLLTIPAIALVYYFKKYKSGLKGILTALFISFALLCLVVFVLIPLLVRMAAWFDLLFVNGFGLPFNSGSVFYLAALFFAFLFLLKFSHQYNKVNLNKIVLALLVFCLGYSSYITLSVRAAANPPINLNRVTDPFSLLAYISREQYIMRPLLYGPYYNAPVTGYKKRHTFVPMDGRYSKSEQNGRYLYDKRFMTLFPRMSSDDPGDIAAYRRWGHIKGSKVPVLNREGKSELIIKPTFHENLRFFIRYQLGYMYFRYFMWNFAGRQTENQGNGGILNGNWISGIQFLDEWRLGLVENYPETLKANQGRNKYYFLPLLLGIIGLIHQFKRERKNFIVVLFFFILTGAAVVVYLNEIPVTPRERDYATGGSFYVFCIWIGLGCTGIIQFLRRRIPTMIALISGISFCVIFVPLLMALENHDDHDRSRRYVARDIAYNYLNSCAPNAILFTNADNDTYPLWYLQEVEGIRTDVRVILAPFLSADWYIRQLQNWQYKAAPVPMTIRFEKYASGKINSVPYYKRTGQIVNLKDVIEFIGSDDPRVKLRTDNDSDINYYPTNLFRLPADTTLSGTSPVDFTVNTNYLWKKDLVLLDILATNNWQRPVYFLSAQVPGELGLKDYLKLDGFAFRLVHSRYDPDSSSGIGSIDADELYKKLMKEFRWGNMNDPGVFMDYNCIRTTAITGIRQCFARLAGEYIEQGNPLRAVEVLDYCMKLMPHRVVPYDIFMLPVISAYNRAGSPDKAARIIAQYRDMVEKELDYYTSLNSSMIKDVDYEIKYSRYILNELTRLGHI